MDYQLDNIDYRLENWAAVMYSEHVLELILYTLAIFKFEALNRRVRNC